MLTLRAEPRGTKKADRNGARREGFIPAVIYGNDVESRPIRVSGKEFLELLRKGGTHKMIRLTGLDMANEPVVLLKDLARGTPHQEILHVDFFQPAAGQKVHIRVHVRVMGEEALTKRGLVLEHQLHDVECECLPEHVPANIPIDVSMMEPGEHITISGLPAPPNVRIAGPQDAVVVLVKEPSVSIIPGEGAVEVTTAVEP